jgi:hypothetical protein
MAPVVIFANADCWRIGHTTLPNSAEKALYLSLVCKHVTLFFIFKFILQHTSYPMGTEGSFPGGKASHGREADHSPPASAEVKKMWIYTSTLP